MTRAEVAAEHVTLQEEHAALERAQDYCHQRPSDHQAHRDHIKRLSDHRIRLREHKLHLQLMRGEPTGV